MILIYANVDLTSRSFKGVTLVVYAVFATVKQKARNSGIIYYHAIGVLNALKYL